MMAGLRRSHEGGHEHSEARSKIQFLLQSAASLAATSMVTAGLGFIYWALAARIFTASAVGESSTAISAMGLLAPLTMLGLGTLVMVQLPRMQQGRTALVASATLVSGVAASIVSLACALLLPSGYLGIPNIARQPATILIFVALVATQVMGLVMDQALLAVLGGSIQLARNMIQAVVKLVLLVVLALLLERFGALSILLSWLFANIVSIAAIIVVLMRQHTVRLRQIRPSLSALRGMHIDAAQHHALNISLMVPYFAMPIVANVILGSEKAAYLYATWSLAGFVFFLPVSLATALFASGARDSRTFNAEFRFTIRVAAAICAAANLVILVVGGPVLKIFGDAYAENGRTVLIVLALGGMGLIVKDHHVTLARVTGHIGREAEVMIALGVLEIVGAVIGAYRGGLLGLSLGWLAAIGVEVVVCGPQVWHAYLGRSDGPVRQHNDGGTS
jgi:O-antigen/teichoic acid export membrane protein